MVLSVAGCDLDLVPDNMFGPEIRVTPSHITLTEGRCGYVDVYTHYGWCDPWTYHASTNNEHIARLGCPGPPWNTDTLPANVTGIAPGWTTIKYEIWCGEMYASANLIVDVKASPARSLALSVDTATMMVRQFLWIEALPRDGTGHAVFAHDAVWSSADTSIALAVNGDWVEGKPVGVGRIFGLRPGRTTVTASVNGLNASATITVADST